MHWPKKKMILTKVHWLNCYKESIVKDTVSIRNHPLCKRTPCLNTVYKACTNAHVNTFCKNDQKCCSFSFASQLNWSWQLLNFFTEYYALNNVYYFLITWLHSTQIDVSIAWMGLASTYKCRCPCIKTHIKCKAWLLSIKKSIQRTLNGIPCIPSF